MRSRNGLAPTPSDRAQVWLPAPLAYAAGFGLGWAVHRLWPGPMLKGPAARGLGALLLAGGGALAAWSLWEFRRAGTSPDPARPSRRLVTEGPYRFSRHPQYLALTATYAGASLWLGAAAPLALLPAVLYVTARGVVEPEEAYLARRFGAEYEAWRKRVPRWCGLRSR